MFYSGLSVRYYDLFFSAIDESELSFFAKQVETAQSPALEIGCGTGRILIPLLEQGLAVEGFDYSPEMLAQCTKKALKLGLEPVLYQQSIQSLSLPKRYGCLYSPLGTFQQLADCDDVYQALHRFYEHLLPNGKLIIYLYLPWYNALEFGQWHAHDLVPLKDGNILRVHEKGVHDPIAQQLFMSYRYELWAKDRLIDEELREMAIRWYSRYEFELMLERVGFKNIKIQTGYEDNGPFDVMLFMATK